MCMYVLRVCASMYMCVHMSVCMHIEVFVIFFVKFMRCACELVEYVLRYIEFVLKFVCVLTFMVFVLKICEICIMYEGFVFEFVKCVFEFMDFF
jgi:hypothetical protein